MLTITIKPGGGIRFRRESTDIGFLQVTPKADGKIQIAVNLPRDIRILRDELCTEAHNGHTK